MCHKFYFVKRTSLATSHACLLLTAFSKPNHIEKKFIPCSLKTTHPFIHPAVHSFISPSRKHFLVLLCSKECAWSRDTAVIKKETLPAFRECRIQHRAFQIVVCIWIILKCRFGFSGSGAGHDSAFLLAPRQCLGCWALERILRSTEVGTKQSEFKSLRSVEAGRQLRSDVTRCWGSKALLGEVKHRGGSSGLSGGKRRSGGGASHAKETVCKTPRARALVPGPTCVWAPAQRTGKAALLGCGARHSWNP